MPTAFLKQGEFPYCPGCGHAVVAKSLAEALSRLQVDPRNVVLVSDIGCCGLIDGLVNAHTVHGLHGRSPALAQGISMALSGKGKKVLAVIGDGGASIGLQHLLFAARWGIDMTVILHNNLVYGMTGGQRSALSPAQGETATPAMDVCALAAAAGAALVRRLFVDDDVTEALHEALACPGFSLVEVVENCPSHGVAKLNDLRQFPECRPFYSRREATPFSADVAEKPSLLQDVPRISPCCVGSLREQRQIAVAGSAGEGVQLAGELAALAATAAGLYSEKRGEYPITVGKGFSLVHMTISPQLIDYADVSCPDVVIAVSQAGWEKAAPLIREHTEVIADESLEVSQIVRHRLPFRRLVGGKGAALAALVWWGCYTGVLPKAAFDAVIGLRRHAEKSAAVIARVTEEWFASSEPSGS